MRTWLTQTQQSNLMTDGQIKALELEYLHDTFQDRTEYQKAQTVMKQASKVIEQKRAEWISKGINPNDATWIRLTIEVLKHFGIAEKQLNSLFDGIIN